MSYQDILMDNKFKFLVPVIAAIILSGCMVGPDYKTPETELPGSFVNRNGKDYTSDAIEIEWWRGFGDPTLDRLVVMALKNNYDIQIATARIMEARAFRTETAFELFPIITSDGSYTRERVGESIAPPGIDRDTDFYDAGFDAIWELDFFGRIRRTLEADTAELESRVATRHDVIVTLLAEVARNYFELRGAQNQLNVATRNAENQQQTLNLTIALLEGGRGTELDTSRARAQLNTTLATIPPLETSIKRAIHRLGVLTGQLPDSLTSELLPDAPLPIVPELVNLGTPDELLRRRPDIRVAERNLAAFTALIGVATADLFPRISLLGSISLQADTFSGLFDSASEAFFIAPNIFWAAFDMGRVYQSVRAADARTQAAFAEYQLTVLTAIEEVENALVDHSNEIIRNAYLKESADSSEQAMTLARLRYEAGFTDFLTVLDAERTLLEAQDELARSETLLGTSLIEVYKTLGGGWEIEPEILGTTLSGSIN